MPTGSVPGSRQRRGTSACDPWPPARGLVLAHEEDSFDGPARHEPEVDEALLAAERAAGVREAMTQLPWRWQRLMEMLMADPPASYAEISDELGLPVGSIGPTRGRCLARLRVLLEAS